MKRLKGFTLIEILVVIGVLAIIVVVGSTSFFNLLKGSTKTRTASLVKQNGDYALAVMERMIRSGKIIENTEVPPQECESGGMSKIKILNPDGGETEFSCEGDAISSNSATLISSQVKVANGNCSFNCQRTNIFEPDVVTINFTLQAQEDVRPEEKVSIVFKTTVVLRNIAGYE